MYKMEERKLVLIENIMGEDPNFTMNGQPAMRSGIGILCPNCKKPLYFCPIQEKVEEVIPSIYKYFDDVKEQLKEDANYCAKCGQKILFPSLLDGEIVKEEQA